jgi:Zn-dependent peptidase ImmA (M78 family)/transcriptional regulator with XRE-family HTH domain
MMTMKTNLSPGNDEIPEFNPSRLTIARERRGLTKQRLAELCGVARRTVSLWEAGGTETPPVDLLATVLEFPRAFFYADDTPEVRSEWVSFRALSSMTARQVGRIIAAAQLAVEFDDWIQARYNTPPLDIPELPDTSSVPPAVMAENVRSAWDLYEQPVKNVLTLLERKGIRVFSLPVSDREIDAFSFHKEGRAYIFLNTAKTAERMRFDLAHELGHLIMHRYTRKNRSKSIEDEANGFAASFLIPADGLDAQIVGPLRFEDMLQLKRYWKVSAMAMVERLWELQHISDWTRRQWIVELTQRGYRLDEPDGIHPEASKLLSQVFRLVREDGGTIRRIADDLNVYPQHIDDCVFGLAMASLPGGNGSGEPPRVGHLHRVK